MRRLQISWVFVLLWLLATPAGSEAGLIFTGVGGLHPTNTSTVAYGLSADGSTVVGHSLDADGKFQAFRWTMNGGIEGLGFLQPTYSNRSSRVHGGGVSADGSVVAGQSPTTSPTISEKPFRWVEGSGMQLIPDLPGQSYAGFARDVDDSGTVVIGRQASADAGSGSSEAFRWSQTGGIEGLGDLPGDRFFSEARGVSGDGDTVVGYS